MIDLSARVNDLELIVSELARPVAAGGAIATERRTRAQAAAEYRLDQARRGLRKRVRAACREAVAEAIGLTWSDMVQATAAYPHPLDLLDQGAEQCARTVTP